MFVRRAAERGFPVSAVNSPGSIESSAHLIQYDSIHGAFDREVKIEKDSIHIGPQKIRYTREKDPARIQWEGVDLVLESSGVFKLKEDLKRHFKNKVKKILTAMPVKEADFMAVYGVNHEDYKPGEHHIISNASCTTNCLAPLVLVMDQNFGIEKSYMTTIHAYTSDQRLLDGAHKDLRRARSAALSMIPTTTGAGSAIEKIFPHLKGKVQGLSIRVPVSNVSLLEWLVFSKKNLTHELIRGAFENFQKNSSILKIEDRPLVSQDFISSPLSAILDFDLTKVQQNSAQLFAWYDNEAGYTERLLDMIHFMDQKGIE